MKIGRAGEASVVVIDASVAVEFLVQLQYTAHAALLFGELIQPESTLQLWAPDLLFPESASALRKLVLLKSISAAAGTTAIDRLGRLPIATTGTAALLADAWKMRSNVTIYDACYVALARRLDAPFVTADERLTRNRRRLRAPDRVARGDRLSNQRAFQMVAAPTLSDNSVIGAEQSPQRNVRVQQSLQRDASNSASSIMDASGFFNGRLGRSYLARSHPAMYEWSPTLSDRAAWQ